MTGMTYDCHKGKYVIDKSNSTKVFIHRHARYKCVLERLQGVLFPRESKNLHRYTFALVDTTGNPLCSTKGDMSLQQDDGTEKLVPWTLQTYLSVKNIRFPSKLKLYCLLQTRSVGTAATRPGMVYTHTKLGVKKAIRMISVHVLALAL